MSRRETIESGSRRQLIEHWATRAGRMPRAVLQNVDECASHLAGRSQLHAVPTIYPHLTAAKEQAIEATSETHGQPAHTGGQRLRVARLDDQVQVIFLNGVMDNAEIRAIRSPKAAQHRWRDELTAQ